MNDSVKEFTKTAREYLDEDKAKTHYIKDWLSNWIYEACDIIDRQADELEKLKAKTGQYVLEAD